MKRSTRILVSIFAVVMLLGFSLFVVYADRQLQQSLGQQAQSVTLRGETTCLPHKGDGPHTMECAIGLKADNGDYYALQDADFFDTNVKVEVTGRLEPTSHSQYDIVGTIQQAKVEKLE